jgi:hypothetical protein
MYQLSDDDLSEAIADTEQEIFSSSTGGDLDPEDVESWDDIIEDQSRMHGWDDALVDDAKLAREATGDTPIGMSMGVDDDDLDAARAEGYQQGAQALYRELAPHLPQPQRPDMFANPQEWEANLLAQMRGGGVAPPSGYGNSPYQKPDQFADPDGYERWLLAEARRQSGANQWNEGRVNNSMHAAAQEYGEDFHQAYRDITQGLDPNNPAHRDLVQNVVNSSDPGRALMQARDFVETANNSSMRYSGPPFAPGLVRRGAPLRNSAGESPRSREESIEQSIFNDATGLDEIWSGYGR